MDVKQNISQKWINYLKSRIGFDNLWNSFLEILLISKIYFLLFLKSEKMKVWYNFPNFFSVV